ncbi:MAG: formate--tetrahydrofolate ligase, partial [Lachnospiraceae bacterium]|nr:formate--tetrahydrofolate ligase [Lachnospiraceae bacterium]
SAVVLVATVRALKCNGGVAKEELNKPDIEALRRGIVNLGKHIENLQKYKVPVIVTLNAFVSDTEEEKSFIERYVREKGCEYSYSEAWEKGGEGALDLARKVVDTCENGRADFRLLYPDDMPLIEKIETVSKEIYGADGVDFSKKALNELRNIEAMGYGSFPVCMAKTQYSLSDDPLLLGRPEGFNINVRDVYVSSGAGFVVVLTGEIMTMPGLSSHPAAYDIDVDENGRIRGLF